VLTVDRFELLQPTAPTVLKHVRLLKSNPRMLCECITVVGSVTLTNFGLWGRWDTFFMSSSQKTCIGSSLLSYSYKRVICFSFRITLKCRTLLLASRKTQWALDGFEGLNCATRKSGLHTVAVLLSIKTRCIFGFKLVARATLTN
jgi:hypothetical protein